MLRLYFLSLDFPPSGNRLVFFSNGGGENLKALNCIYSIRKVLLKKSKTCGPSPIMGLTIGYQHFIACYHLSGLPWSLPATFWCVLCWGERSIQNTQTFRVKRHPLRVWAHLSKHALMYLIIMIRTDTFLQNKCIPVLLLRHTNKAQWCSATIGINAVEACPSPQ